MSLSERIREIKEEQRQSLAAEHAASELEAKNAVIRARQELANKEAVRKAKIELIQSVFEESGALETLKEMDHMVSRHKSSVDHEFLYNPDEGYAIVAWGNNFVLQENGEVEAKSRGIDEYRFSYVRVIVSTEENGTSLTVEGGKNEQFGEKEWKQQIIVEKALAKAYLNPRTVNKIHEEPQEDEHYIWPDYDPGAMGGNG